MRKASEARKSAASYCSRGCYFAAIRNGRIPSPSQGAAARRKISESKRGARNPMFKDGLAEKTVSRVFNLRLKGEHHCRRCCSPNNLHLHHIVPRSMSKAAIKDLRNGMALCAACHLGWHRRTVTIHRELLTSEEWDYVSSLQLQGQNIQAWLEDRYPSWTTDERAA